MNNFKQTLKRKNMTRESKLKNQGKQNELEEKNKGGRRFTSGLFIQQGGDTYDLLEFYNIFMASNDPTCRAFAMQAFLKVPPYERWREFKRMLGNSWFANHITDWHEELEVKMRSDAIQEIANGCEAKDFTRNKWLAEGKASNTPKTGRPSLDEAKKEDRMQNELRRINPGAFDIVMGK